MMESLRKLIVPLLMMYTCECTDLTDCPITGPDLRSASGRLRCNVTYQYHCILNGKGNLLEKCLQFRWMTKGYCPVFIENANNGLGAIHEKICLKEDGNVKGCPSTRAYKSSDVFQFPACFDVTNRIKTTRVPLVLSENVRKHDEDTVTSTVAEDEGYVGITGFQGIIGVTAGVIVPLHLLIAVICLKCKRKQNTGTDVKRRQENLDDLHSFLLDRQSTESPASSDLEINIVTGEIQTCVYDKRDQFGFNIVNFPWLDGDAPWLPSYSIYFSQLISYARACTDVSDFRNVPMGKAPPSFTGEVIDKVRKIKDEGIVQLAVFAEGRHILKENGILIITGKIGSGKTTAMKSIIQHLQEEDSELKEKNISFLTPGRSKSSNDKLIIKWDDCFGKFVTNPGKQNNTMHMFTEIRNWVAEGDGNRKCIITMRENEFSSFNLYDLFRTNDKVQNIKVCLDNISEREKNLFVAEMSKQLSSCGECSDINRSKITYQLTDETKSVTLSLLGWPLICRLAKIPYIAKNINGFTKDPVRCVMSLFDTLKSTDQQLYCAMIYVLVKGRSSNIYSVDSALLRKIHKTLAPAQDKENLIGTEKTDITDEQLKILSPKLTDIFLKHPHYFVTKDKECYELYHEIFVLWLLCHFYKEHPKITIKHFDFDVLAELLRPNKYIVERDENDIAMLCSFDDKNNVHVPKHAVQSEEDIVQRVHFETGIQTISSDTLKQPQEGIHEKPNWIFTLQEKMFPCFIKRVGKEKEIVQKLQVENDKKFDMLEGHPLLHDETFNRIYKQEEAMISV